MIPFFELKRQYEHIRNELHQASERVFDSGSFIAGEEVAKFEKSFAHYLRAKHCISCGNGTDAIELILRYWGISGNDEVIIPALTWISDASVVQNLGAKAIFADIDPENCAIDPEEIQKKINSKTKAIIAVHIYGKAAPIDEILKIANKNNLMVLEDCAHAPGAEYKGQKVGTFGDAAIFSFYPTKNLGAYGDAGAVVTNDTNLARQVRLKINHGQESRDKFLISGRNSRTDELQAAFLNVKLKYLDQWNSRRRSIAHYYNENLKYVGLPSFPDGYEHVFHQYVIKTDRRDELKSYLLNNKIRTAIHYPDPLPSTKPFLEENSAINYPVAAKRSKEILSLPIFPELTDQEVEVIAEKINSFFR